MNKPTINYELYNKMNILVFDIENALDGTNTTDNIHTVKKIFYYFNKSSIEGKYAKPFLIKFFTTDDKEYAWSINDIYRYLSYVPKFLLSVSNVPYDFNFIDTSNKIFPIKKADSINKFKPFDDEAYDFEVNFGSKIVSRDVINNLCELLETHEIFYEFDNDDKPEYIIIYPNDANYKIFIALNGKINKAHAYEISPFIDTFETVQVVGKFNIFSKKPTAIPNDDDLAILTTCPHCHKSIIINWWAVHGTSCPFCNKSCKFYV